MDPTLVSLDSRSGQFISENSEIPPDIIFKFASAGGEDTEVAAHKMILAMVSQPFRNMFFVHNTVDMSANEMMMEDTTKPPFQMMIDAVYSVKPMKKSLQGKSIHEMFAVLYLVTKYEISELELAVKECLASFPISEDNALEVAGNAMEYSTTFGEAAQNLLLACAKFLKSNFMTDNEYFVRIVAENGARIATVQKLAVLIKDLAPPPGPPTCSGCKKISTECLNETSRCSPFVGSAWCELRSVTFFRSSERTPIDRHILLNGHGVTNRNAEIGIKVVQNPSNRIRINILGTGVLVKKDERNGRWVIRWENGEEEDGGWPLVNAGGMWIFSFKCH